MSQFTWVRWCFLLLVLLCQIATAGMSVHHELDVSVKPQSGYLEASDSITLPRSTSEISFALHAGLKLNVETPGAKIVAVKSVRSAIPIKRYKIRLPDEQTHLQLKYSGKIQHKLKDRSRDYSGGRETTAGIISEQGVFLSLSSYWFPVFNSDQISFSLSAKLPEGWHSISQGENTGENSWSEAAPQDDIYLVAGKYHVYKRSTDVAEAQVYLRQPDEKLAERYLQATEDYLKLFSNLIGPYPYSKFALVENFWESGYGMPSFTLLGPRVIRFPFILHSSYPHEILHNWWGNGVFVDYSTGNWSEGLTSYLADHLIKERRGLGSSYRRDTLQSYSDYVSDNQDSALKDFRGHHGQTSQAIGYGKTLMFFHMLRQYLGDEIFLEGIRLFYKDNIYKAASFDDIRLALEKASGKDLSEEFTQWTSRTGAPALEVLKPISEAVDNGFNLSFVLRQTQQEEPFRLNVPVYIQTEDSNESIRHTVNVIGRETDVAISLKKRPLQINVDPLFDLFRRLDPGEIPSSLGQLFGVRNPMIILPSKADPGVKNAYEQVTKIWKKRAKGIKVVWDNKIKSIPENRMVWLFGKENLMAQDFLKTSTTLPLSIQNELMDINGNNLSLSENSFVVTSRRPMTIGWLHGHSEAAIPGLAKKVPHYGKYSYLAFSGDNPDNILKGQWPTTNSGLIRQPVEGVPQLIPREHTPLVDPNN